MNIFEAAKTKNKTHYSDINRYIVSGNGIQEGSL